MKALSYAGLGLAALWLQLTVGDLLSIGWIRPDLLLLTVVLAGLRWMEPWLFVYGALAGLAQDVFSHGMLGVYGISFFFTAVASRITGAFIYENNLVVTMIAAFGLCLGEGLTSVTLLHLLDANVPWWGWVLGRVVPAAAYDSLLAPFVLYGLARLERWLKWSMT